MTVTRRAVLGGGAGLGIVALGGIGLSRFLRSSAPDADVHAVLFDLDQPVLGNPQGDVTVAEFFDYQCPFCKRGHDDLMAEVEADGNLRLIMKDWPIFGGASVIARPDGAGRGRIRRLPRCAGRVDGHPRPPVRKTTCAAR